MAIIDDFRENVVPRLREAVRVQAFFAALEIVDTGEALAEVNALARKLGSGLLPPKHQDRLFEWIRELIWTELEKADDRVAVIGNRIEAAEKSNPVRLWEGLATRCSDPECMRWTFASFSKPYRQHLIRERRRARTA